LRFFLEWGKVIEIINGGRGAHLKTGMPGKHNLVYGKPENHNQFDDSGTLIRSFCPFKQGEIICFKRALPIHVKNRPPRNDITRIWWQQADFLETTSEFVSKHLSGINRDDIPEWSYGVFHEEKNSILQNTCSCSTDTLDAVWDLKCVRNQGNHLKIYAVTKGFHTKAGSYADPRFPIIEPITLADPKKYNAVGTVSSQLWTKKIGIHNLLGIIQITQNNHFIIHHN
jgi:hypothetical protein